MSHQARSSSRKPGRFPSVAASLTVVAAIASSAAIALYGACSSSPTPCRTASDCNGGCCVLTDANAATGLCGDPGSGQCLCIGNQDCSGSPSCCQPFIDGTGRVTEARVCAIPNDTAGLFECCMGGGPICGGSNCCVNMSTGGEYCALPCNTDADCNGGSCVEGSPVDIFGCGNGKYCGPGTMMGPTSSGFGGSGSTSTSSSGFGGSGSTSTSMSAGPGAGPSSSSSSSGGLPAGSACTTSPQCNSGCCGLQDAGAATGACADQGAGVTCLCVGNNDCPGSNACCEPLLDSTGRATSAQACAKSPGDSPYALQCCQGGITTCQGTLCCANMSTGGEYCAKPCSTDADCFGGHCVAGNPVDVTGCGNGKYCGPGTAQVPGPCTGPADCYGGCCVLTDADAGTGECLALDAGNPPDGGASCLCHGNADCPATGACCQPFLNKAGAPTPSQVCVGSSSANPGEFQCCGFGASCQTNTCCVDMSTGGEYCAVTCTVDSDCHGGHCVAGSAIDFFGCGGPKYCGP